MMSTYLETTYPSDYDLEKPWFCTIGKYEFEWLAYAITAFLQKNGDEWRPVRVEELEEHYRWGTLDSIVMMREHWLEKLQKVRKEMPGPPELVIAPRAKTGFQLRYPNGRIIEAGFVLTEEKIRELKEIYESQASDGQSKRYKAPFCHGGL